MTTSFTEILPVSWTEGFVANYFHLKNLVPQHSESCKSKKVHIKQIIISSIIIIIIIIIIHIVTIPAAANDVSCVDCFISETL